MSRKRNKKKDAKDEIEAMRKILVDEASNQMKMRNYAKALIGFNQVSKENLGKIKIPGKILKSRKNLRFQGKNLNSRKKIEKAKKSRKNLRKTKKASKFRNKLEKFKKIQKKVLKSKKF